MSGAVVIGIAIALVLGIGRGDMAVPASVTADGGLSVSAQQAQGVANAQTVTGPEPLRIELYTDYTHPDSARFASSSALVIQELVQDGAAEVSLFPIAVSEDPDEFANAVRVGNAVACVADHAPKSLWSFQVALLALQPHGEETQLRGTDLVTVARDTGVQNVESVTSCITDEHFGEWIARTSSDARSDGVGTRGVQLGRMPVVLVDETPYTGSIDSSTDFRAFLSDRIGDRFDT